MLVTRTFFYTLPVLAVLAGCNSQQISNKPKSVEELGIATPAHPVNSPARLEETPGAPMQLPVNSPAVPRATDAGSADEGGPIEDKE